MAKEFVDQHIVPKSYLDRFAIPTGNGHTIGTRLLQRNKAAPPKFFPASTSDVGYIKNYYDVNDKEDSKYWEHFFASNIDTLCGAPIQRIISGATLSVDRARVLSVADRKNLSSLIMAQMFRIPDSIKYVNGPLYEKTAKEVKRSIMLGLQPFLPKQMLDRIDKTDLTPMELKQLFFNYSFAPENFERYCEILNNRIYVVYYNSRARVMPFITSDNPVVVEGIGRNELGLFRNGIADPATCLFFPISPAVAIANYSRAGVLSSLAEQYDNRLVVLDDIKYVASMNYKEILQAYQHSFLLQPLFDECRTAL